MISTRTPEGQPGNCRICNASLELEFSDPLGDATCHNCGSLIWQVELDDAVPIALMQLIGVATRKSLTGTRQIDSSESVMPTLPTKLKIEPWYWDECVWALAALLFFPLSFIAAVSWPL